MKAALLYSNLFDFNGCEQKIGGVETYLLNLAEVCQEMEIEPTIYQYANQYFCKKIDNTTIKGIPVFQVPHKKRASVLFNAAIKEIQFNKDLIIFGTCSHSTRTEHKRAIAIQHGISWDLPLRYSINNPIFHSGILSSLCKAYLLKKYISDFRRCPNLVCVDYNFINWYRACLVSDMPFKSWVIPNFVNPVSEEQINNREYGNSEIKILFARRFNLYRGTRLMAEAVKNILKNSTNIHFTFAGEGPDENYLRQLFLNDHRVQFLKYYPTEIQSIHLQHHIAVIPSLGSEGTSLSVAEAMGCGCAVIATAVGGVTNMIINNYNGILVDPNVQELTDAIFRLVNNLALTKQLGINAFKVAVDGFSLNEWKEKWRKVIKTVISN